MRIIFSSFIFFSYFLIFHIFHLISSFAPHLIATSSSSCSSRVLSERTKKKVNNAVKNKFQILLLPHTVHQGSIGYSVFKGGIQNQIDCCLKTLSYSQFPILRTGPIINTKNVDRTANFYYYMLFLLLIRTVFKNQACKIYENWSYNRYLRLFCIPPLGTLQPILPYSALTTQYCRIWVFLHKKPLQCCRIVSLHLIEKNLMLYTNFTH